jgi:hypothetical protein
MAKAFLVVLCVLAATASTATAQSDDVIVDPGSPSGKEYAFPIDAAREQAAKGAKGGSRTGDAPLFGEGVGDDAGSRTAKSSRKVKDAARSGGARSSIDRSTPQAADSASGATAVSREAGVQSSGLGMGAVTGAGLGVVLLGGLAGLWLRRRPTT